MNVKSIIVLFTVVSSWLTAPLIKKSEWKRFYPALFFMSIFIAIESYIAYKRKWWEFPKGTILHDLKDAPFVVGPFFIGTLWILKFTYGNLKKYILVNTLIDTGFVYGLMLLMEKFNIMRLVKLKKYQFMSLFFLKAISIYGFQYLKDMKRLKA
ncbi:hypothetical protein [Priestia endophytica]|uniref:hypothetical protein n=1 Tax=Priestia endophytica TaxID=135735 RepID=UPI0022803FBD|nr:hypothetical protein [Priestia endophytica]MCY8235284.1 hypothetical protein [Priestia endophytica]